MHHLNTGHWANSRALRNLIIIRQREEQQAVGRETRGVRIVAETHAENDRFANGGALGGQLELGGANGGLCVSVGGGGNGWGEDRERERQKRDRDRERVGEKKRHSEKERERD